MIASVLLVGLAAPVAMPVLPWRGEIEQAAERFHLPFDWIERVMRVESGGRRLVDGRPIRSAKGAIGLMQIMPATWEMVRSMYRLGADPDDPHDNIMAGAAYLRALYDRFGYPALFAAYNAGPARYQAFVAGRAALPAETRSYVGLILSGVTLKQAAMGGPTGARQAMPLVVRSPRSLFFVEPKNVHAERDGAVQADPARNSGCQTDIGLWAVPPPCA